VRYCALPRVIAAGVTGAVRYGALLCVAHTAGTGHAILTRAGAPGGSSLHPRGTSRQSVPSEPTVPTLRSLAVFTCLYLAVLAPCQSIVPAGAVVAPLFLIAGVCATSPLPRRNRVAPTGRHTRRRSLTCAITSPEYEPEQPDWRFIGTVREWR